MLNLVNTNIQQTHPQTVQASLTRCKHVSTRGHISLRLFWLYRLEYVERSSHLCTYSGPQGVLLPHWLAISASVLRLLLSPWLSSAVQTINPSSLQSYTTWWRSGILPSKTERLILQPELICHKPLKNKASIYRKNQHLLHSFKGHTMHVTGHLIHHGQ